MHKEDVDNSSSGSTVGKVIISFVFVGVIVLWLSYPIWSYIYKGWFFNSKFIEMGVFGDSYGALNTLFSALAFTGIIASIYFQREELKATREELKETRKEMKNQGDQFEAQTKALNIQVFENTFFNMMKLHGDIVEGVEEFGDDGVIIKGRRAFKKICENCHDYRYRISGMNDFIVLYEYYHNNNEASIGHYFRVLYQIIKFIDDSTLDEAKKKTYVNIIRAQLSTYELILLQLNCLSKYGVDKHKPLIEKYSVLEHVSIATLQKVLHDFCHFKEIVTRYNISAYGTTNSVAIESYNSQVA